MPQNYATLSALKLFCMPNGWLATRSHLDAINYSSPSGSQNGTVGAIAMGLSTFGVAWCNGDLSVAGSAQIHLACEVTGGNDIVSYNYLNGSCAGVIDGKWPPICVSKSLHLCFGVYLCSCFTMLHLGSSIQTEKEAYKKRGQPSCKPSLFMSRVVTRIFRSNFSERRGGGHYRDVSPLLPESQRAWSCPLCNHGLPELPTQARNRAIRPHCSKFHPKETPPPKRSVLKTGCWYSQSGNVALHTKPNVEKRRDKNFVGPTQL